MMGPGLRKDLELWVLTPVVTLFCHQMSLMGRRGQGAEGDAVFGQSCKKCEITADCVQDAVPFSLLYNSVLTETLIPVLQTRKLVLRREIRGSLPALPDRTKERLPERRMSALVESVQPGGPLLLLKCSEQCLPRLGAANGCTSA